MHTELQQDTTTRDVELPGACTGCGGVVTVRFTPGRAHGVCLACHLVTQLGLTRADDELHLVQLPAATA